MLTLDDRTGSVGLFTHLNRAGLPVVLGRLAYGDISFIGSGEGGSPVSIGVEVKQLSDVLKCIVDGRFAGHQLPGLLQSYDQVWLLIEGMWRANAVTGALQTRRGKEWIDAHVGTRKFLYADLVKWLLTIQTKTGIGCVRCTDWGEAILWISSLYTWWLKGSDEHKSHLVLHNPDRGQFFDRAILSRPSTLRLVASQLPGIGYDKSAEIARFFGTVDNLVNASVWDLQQVPGVGKTMAERIFRSLRE